MARPKKPAKRTKKLSAPANEDELKTYTDACALVKVEPADTLRKLADGFAEHVRTHKSISFPIRFESPAKK